MASIVLPTPEWTPSCQQLASQLTDDDELLIVCDRPTDPVGDRSLPPRTQLLVAGEPVGCSGKANAVATGLEQASCNRIIVTDNDLERGDEWLATMKRLGDEHGPVTAIPVFVSDEYPFRLLEPFFACWCSFGITVSTVPWGGGVTFDRREIDLEGYVRDLRRTVADDVLLGEYVAELTPAFDLVHEIPVAGGPKATVERVTRFVQSVDRFDRLKTVGPIALALGFLALMLVFPLVAVGLTFGMRAWYRRLGVSRRSWLLTVPSILLTPFVLAGGILRREFRWGGRRYRWPSRFAVTVLE